VYALRIILRTLPTPVLCFWAGMEKGLCMWLPLLMLRTDGLISLLPMSLTWNILSQITEPEGEGHEYRKYSESLSSLWRV